jgi:hypothetical protein
VSEENVLRFDPSFRSGMARRGAPDKTQSQTIEVECPFCAAVLCLDASILRLRPEVLCAGCESTIPIAEHEASDIGR